MTTNARIQERTRPPNSSPGVTGQLDELQLLRTAAQSRALMRAGMTVLSELDEEALLTTALDSVWSLLRADLVAFFLTTDQEEQPRLRALRTPEGSQIIQGRDGAPLSLPLEVLASRVPVEISRPWRASPLSRNGDILRSVQSVLIAPLDVRGSHLGALAVGKRGLEPFRRDHVEILSTLAQQVALAVDNARRIDKAQLQERRTRDLLDSVADALFVVDGGLRIVYLNQAAAALVRQPADRVLGRPVLEVLRLLDEAGSSTPPEATPFPRAIKEGRVVTETAVLALGESGSSLPVAFSVAPVKAPDGQAAYAVGIVHDVSREKKIERMKTEFVSMASHEIRTPLAALQGFTELLLSRDVSPSVQRDWLNLMNQESTRLATLIEELLDLTRIESGRMRLRREPVSIADLVSRVVALMERHEKRPRFEFCLREDLPQVMADPGKLTQVLANLVSNAINYSPRRSSMRFLAQRGCLAKPGTEHLGPLAEDGGVACPAGISVAVRDRGLGVAPGDLRRIFEPFYRAHPAKAEGPGGAGLGLAIAKAVVERHGGRMWVESSPGRGSTFGFCLPLDERSAPWEHGDTRFESGPIADEGTVL
ncbi:MAG: ATP-binding protein [Dehalococcoidia bacterium]